MILAKFYQNFSQNTKFWSARPKELFFLLIACSEFAHKSIHQIAWFQLQKYKIFQLLRGAHPSQTPPPPPCKQAHNWHWCATKSYPKMLKTDLCPWKSHTLCATFWLTVLVNSIPLEEWTWRNCIFNVRQTWNVCCLMFVRKYAWHVIWKGAVKCLLSCFHCKDAVWQHIHSWSVIKYSTTEDVEITRRRV